MPMDIKTGKGAAEPGPASGANTAAGVIEASGNGNADIATLLATIKSLQERVDVFEGREVLRPAFDGEVPKYRIQSPVFLENDTLYEEGDVIDYLGTPNQEMMPLNDAAQARMKDYIGYLNECAREKANMYGRTFIVPVGDHAAMIAQNFADERKAVQAGANLVPLIQMPVERAEVPPMPHTPEALARARRTGVVPRQELIVSAVAAPKPTNPGIGMQDKILGRNARGSGVA